MLRFQSYVFNQALGMLFAVLAGLAAVALLIQGLSQMDVIIEDRQSALIYLWITVLAAPLVIAITAPLAVFVATVVTLNTLHRESEIVVAQSAGMTRWQTAAPLIRVGVVAAVLQLAINLFLQPAAYREMRSVLAGVSTDLAAVLVQEGEFTSPVTGLTFFAREVRPGGELRGLLIHDGRTQGADSTTYVARLGVLTEVEGTPAILMREGQGHQLYGTSGLNILDFEEYLFDLTPFLREADALRLKASDRYLYELFFPDLTSYWDNQNQRPFLAEGHARLATPLLALAMAMIGVIAVVGGPFNRRGYGERLVWATVAALVLRALALAVQDAAGRDPALNPVQYGLPLVVFVVLLTIYLLPGYRRTSTPKLEQGSAFA
jgi:lipopolysaccharide export system permease protein